MIKPRHIRKALVCLRTGNLAHLQGKKKLIQFVWPLACNLNCQMCHQKDIRRKCEPELSVEQIKNMFKNFKLNGVTQVNLIGGEFFLNKKKAFEVIDAADKERLMYSIATNAALLTPEEIKNLSKRPGLLEIDISLDGFLPVHDKVRGVKGTFEKVTKNIRLIRSYGIPVMLVTVVQKDNLEDLPDFIRYVKSLGVDSLTLVQEYSFPQKDFDSSKKILESISKKDVTIFASASVFPITFKYPYELFKNKVNEAKRVAQEVGLELNTSFELEHGDTNVFEYIYDMTARQTHNVGCNELNCTQIDWTGQKNICPFIRIDNLGCGKVSDGTKPNYFEIDEEQKKIIDKIRAQNLLPMCTRCCSLKVLNHK